MSQETKIISNKQHSLPFKNKKKKKKVPSQQKEGNNKDRRENK